MSVNRVNQLNKAYSKRFKFITKNLVSKNKSGLTVLASDSGLMLFAEHLKYLRDVYIITQTSSADAISTLNAAIEEFDAYTQTHKEFHWNNFCEFVKLNMREWLGTDDSV